MPKGPEGSYIKVWIYAVLIESSENNKSDVGLADLQKIIYG